MQNVKCNETLKKQIAVHWTLETCYTTFMKLMNGFQLAIRTRNGTSINTVCGHISDQKHSKSVDSSDDFYCLKTNSYGNQWLVLVLVLAANEV